MCEDPATHIVGSTVTVVGYENPALEGHIINFSCSLGHGSNTSICIKNGEWGPNPNEICDIMMITRQTTPLDSSHFQSTGILVGSFLGLLLLLITAASITGFLLKGRIKGL